MARRLSTSTPRWRSLSSLVCACWVTASTFLPLYWRHCATDRVNELHSVNMIANNTAGVNRLPGPILPEFCEAFASLMGAWYDIFKWEVVGCEQADDVGGDTLPAILSRFVLCSLGLACRLFQRAYVVRHFENNFVFLVTFD